MDLVVHAIVIGAVGTAGLRCTSSRRVLKHDSIYESLRDNLISAYKQVSIGDPLEKDTLMGPLVNKNAVNDFSNAVERAVKSGGEVLYGGSAIDGPGNFVTPTIVNAENHWDIVQEETFAPILYLIKYDTLEDAISMHNDVPQGLSSAMSVSYTHLTLPTICSV